MSFTVPISLDDPAYQLPGDLYHHLMHTLCRGLPAPPTDHPDALRHRDNAAVACIAALCPANAAEADTAGLYVAASEQWKECLRLAQLPETTLKQAMQCRAQATAMMRQAQGALRLVLRMQAVREKRESTNQSRDRAALTEHCVMNLMLEALGSLPGAADPLVEPLPEPLPPAQPPQAASSPHDRPAPDDQSAPNDRSSPVPARRTAPIPNGISFDLPNGALPNGDLPDCGLPDGDLPPALFSARMPACAQWTAASAHPSRDATSQVRSLSPQLAPGLRGRGRGKGGDQRH